MLVNTVALGLQRQVRVVTALTIREFGCATASTHSQSYSIF